MRKRNAPCAAAARIRGGEQASGIRGMVRFCQQPGAVLVCAEVWGLPETEAGFFALHIHEGPDCAGEGFPDTGGHYDPEGKAHPRHAGDLPPLLNCGGRAYTTVLTDRFRVEDVIGRTVVIHSRPDDFRTQPAGDAGEKIACGVICRDGR